MLEGGEDPNEALLREEPQRQQQAMVHPCTPPTSHLLPHYVGCTQVGSHRTAWLRGLVALGTWLEGHPCCDETTLPARLARPEHWHTESPTGDACLTTLPLASDLHH